MNLSDIGTSACGRKVASCVRCHPARVKPVLVERHWLATVDPDGAPHVVPVGAFWDNGSFYFTSGPGTRKSKNLATNPECVMSVATDPFDITVEGRADRVTDPDDLERIAAIARDRGGWPARVENDAFTAEFSAPSAGPPPWYLYRMTAERVYAFGTAEPYGATRFSF